MITFYYRPHKRRKASGRETIITVWAAIIAVLLVVISLIP